MNDVQELIGIHELIRRNYKSTDSTDRLLKRLRSIISCIPPEQDSSTANYFGDIDELRVHLAKYGPNPVTVRTIESVSSALESLKEDLEMVNGSCSHIVEMATDINQLEDRCKELERTVENLVQSNITSDRFKFDDSELRRIIENILPKLESRLNEMVTNTEFSAQVSRIEGMHNTLHELGCLRYKNHEETFDGFRELRDETDERLLDLERRVYGHDLAKLRERRRNSKSVQPSASEDSKTSMGEAYDKDIRHAARNPVQGATANTRPYAEQLNDRLESVELSVECLRGMDSGITYRLAQCEDSLASLQRQMHHLESELRLIPKRSNQS